MKIRIRKDASGQYVRRCYRHARPDCGMLHNQEFAEMLKAIEGQVIEVETKFLFKDQFNTAPIPGVSKSGMRIMQELVEEVIDDARPGLARCQWCGKTSKDTATCSHCGESKYLEAF